MKKYLALLLGFSCALPAMAATHPFTFKLPPLPSLSMEGHVDRPGSAFFLRETQQWFRNQKTLTAVSAKEFVSRMPIIKPDAGVSSTMPIITPDPNIDFKLRVQTPKVRSAK